MNTEHYFEDIGLWPRSKSGALHLWRSYIVGFLLSFLCTFASFSLALHHLLPLHTLLAIVTLLAVVQVVVQVRFFFHMEKGTESRARFIMLALTSVVVFILVAGSLWIMFDLNERMMPSTAEMMQYMQRQTGI